MSYAESRLVFRHPLLRVLDSDAPIVSRVQIVSKVHMLIGHSSSSCHSIVPWQRAS
jgi:hypothetical protein